MGLRHGDTKEPVAAQVCICPVDARNGGKADQGQIQYLVESSLRWTAFGATWDHAAEAATSCVGTRRGAGAEMAQAGIPEDQSPCTARKSRHLFRRRGAYALGSSFRPHLGQEGRDPGCVAYWGAVQDDTYLGGDCARPYEVHDQGKRRRPWFSSSFSSG